MQKAIIGRQAMYNINGKVIAYELSFRDEDTYSTKITSQMLATSKVVLNVLTHMNQQAVLHDAKRAFISFSEEALLTGVASLLDADTYILLLHKELKLNSKTLALIKRLRKKGFLFALDDFDCNHEMLKRFEPVFQFIDFIFINLNEVSIARTKRFISMFHNNSKKVIAKNVDDNAMFRESIQYGFDFFIGYGCKAPEILEVELPKQASKATLLHIITLIKQDKDINELEKFAKTQPDLVHNLLKYLNSPTVGLEHRIISIRQAMNLLGRERLAKWVLVYIFSESAGDSISDALLKISMNRANSMADMLHKGSEKEKAYLTGMLSLLDVVFEVPMELVLKDLPIEKDIQFAIQNRTGVLGSMLTKVESLEKRKLKAVLDENFNDLNTKDLITLLQEKGLEYSNHAD